MSQNPEVTHPKEAKWPGAFNALGKALDAMQHNPTPVLFYIVVLLATDLISLAFFGKLDNTPELMDVLKTALLQITLSFVFLPFVTRYQLELARGKESTILELLRLDALLYVKLFAAVVLMIALVAVGTLLLVIPLIWVLPWCTMLIFPVVDRGSGPFAALKEVRKLIAKKNFGKVWALLFATMLFSIASIFLSHIPGLGTVVAGFLSLVYNTAFAMLYLWMRAQATEVDTIH